MAEKSQRKSGSNWWAVTKALDFVRGLADHSTDSLSESELLRLHGQILQGIDDQNAGRYRSVAVQISGYLVVLPSYIKVPHLMADFVEQVLKNPQGLHPVEVATRAHYELVTIHPFADGNARTARLLMNLVLIQNGYPPAIISKRQREPYIRSLEKAQLGGSRENFDKMIARAVERSLDIYLRAAKGEDALQSAPTMGLLRIGQLAKLTGQTVPTIRYWTKQGLLQVANRTDSGYTLYEKAQVERAGQVQAMNDQRLSLAEIKNRMDN